MSSSDLPATLSSSPRSLSGFRVLLAEDVPANRRLITCFLVKAGARVDAVENGRLAIDAVLSVHESDHPYELLLTDMQMPVLDGYDMVRELRTRGFHFPIIALTADDLPGEREICLAAGCDYYLAKPIDRAQLLEMISRYVGRASA